MSESLYPPALLGVMEKAFARLEHILAETAPVSYGLFDRWYALYYGSGPRHAPFCHPGAFPMFLLPWYLEECIGGQPDPAFQEDLAYSSLCGYHYIRIIDNLMDNEAGLERAMLPLLHFFHTEFLTIYQIYFPREHNFWRLFKEVWYSTAEVTALDSALDSISYDQFVRIAARKSSAVRIPLAAVALYHGRQDMPAPWEEITGQLCLFHQMYNDLFDWQKDFAAASPTYFLCETKRRLPIQAEWSPEQLKVQIAREGLPWGFALLEEWLDQLIEKACLADSPGLTGYFRQRRVLLEEKKQHTLGLFNPAEMLKQILKKHGVSL